MIPILTGLTWATLTGDSQAQRLPIPDYQMREQPDDCSLAPSDYGPTTLLSFCDTEDYTYLRDLKRHNDFFDPIKYLPLNADGTDYLSFGGEIRERWEYYSQPPLGQGPQDKNGYYLQRYMLHADLHLGQTFRLFTQFKSDLENDRDGGARPSIDEDKANIQQLYLDINFPSFDEGSFTLRLGQQELAYGIVRLIDPREGPNVRQSFDGAKAILHVEKWEIDGFATRLAETNTDRFDNPDPYTKFWGLYATPDLGFIPNAGIDLYYLGLRRNFAPFDSGLATKTRHTLGSRLHGTRGSAAYVGEEANLVGVWQINRHLTFTTSYSHFFAGDYAPEIPGSGSFNYVATWLTFKV